MSETNLVSVNSFEKRTPSVVMQRNGRERGNPAAVPAIALQITMAVTHRTAGGPAATTRAGGPSAVSEHCPGHCEEREEIPQPVPAIALQITMAVTHRTAGGPAATTRAGLCGEREECCFANQNGSK